MKTVLIIVLALWVLPAQAQSDSPPLLNQLLEKVDRLQDEIAELRGKNERLQYEFTRFKERITQELGQASSATTAETSPPAQDTPSQASTATATRVNDREVMGDKKFNIESSQSEYEMYRNAMESLQSGDYVQLRKALSDFLARYSKGKYAANAKYWIAETYYVSEDHRKAQDYYKRVIKEHKNHPRREDAMLKIAYIREANQQWDSAIVIFESLANKAKNEKIRSLAKGRLKKLQQKQR